jgi:hypothetical protein
VLPVGSDDPPLFHGLKEFEQAPTALRPGDRLPFSVLTLAEAAERVQIVVSWKDEAGPHHESFTVQLQSGWRVTPSLPWISPVTAAPTGVSTGRQ